MSAIASLNYLRALTTAVESGSERQVHACLKKFQRPLWVSFARGWNGILLLPEFRVGRRFRADFLLVSVMSGAVHATFIELEAPSARLYVRDGSESAALKRGLRQLKDWSIWADGHGSELREAIVDHIDKLRHDDPRVPAYMRVSVRAEVLDPDFALFDEHVVIIGRRAMLSRADNMRRGHESKWAPAAEIVTYDRLLDAARRDYQRHLEDRARRRATANDPLQRIGSADR